MSDEFLEVARQEIQLELDRLELIASQCNDDEHIFKNAHEIREHVHKIRGLAPMIDHQDVGEIARIGDHILRYIISNGPLSGSNAAITKMIKDMKKIFHSSNSFDISNFRKTMQERFPKVTEL